MSRGTLSEDAARRVALSAQGFGRDHPARVTARHVASVIDRVAQFQIDSVNVAVRAHYMPLFARLGSYDQGLLDRARDVAPRTVFEYWGHAASLIDVRLQPALRTRMARHVERTDDAVRQVAAAHPGLRERVLDDLRAQGPLTPREIEHDEDKASGHWGWNWSAVKRLLEAGFDVGELSIAGRTTAFERRYDLTDRVLPAGVLAQPTPDEDEAHRILVRRAARALGVADVNALATYFYLKVAATRRAVAALEASGELVPVRVAGLPQAHWLWHEASVPRSLDVSALVSPFDTMVFDRKRLAALFGIDYRIEIYTPAAKRRYGYYVDLFLHRDRVAARVDLKADRQGGALIAQATWLEPGAHAVDTARALAGELERMAGWLGLGRVEVRPVGDLADDVAAAL